MIRWFLDEQQVAGEVSSENIAHEAIQGVSGMMITSYLRVETSIKKPGSSRTGFFYILFNEASYFFLVEGFFLASFLGALSFFSALTSA